MIDDDVKAEFRKLDERLARVEQFLPSVATKDDLRPFATRDDLRSFATKDDLRPFATKEDLTGQRRELEGVMATLASKADLAVQRRELETVVATLATKDDLVTQRRELDGVIATLATKNDLLASEERTRRHFDVVAESLRDEIRLALEGNLGATSRIESLEHRHQRLEQRVTTLETPAPRRRK